jgi:predicted MFS family arabinose efflux permease
LETELTDITADAELRARSLWRHPEFMKLWTGQTISELGSRITREGLPYLAATLLAATPAQMGWMAAIASLPALVFSLPAGAWVDRLHRRPILIACDIARALVLCAVPLAAAAGALSIELLVEVLAVSATLTVIFTVAYQSYLPSLVASKQIVDANSKLSLSGSTAEVLGPGLAGVLVQTLTAPVAVLFDALSFLVSAASIVWITKPEPPPAPAHERQSLTHEIAEGLRTLVHHPLLRVTAIAAALLAFFGNFFGALYTLFAVQYLGMNALLLGLTVGVGGVSSVIGSLITQPIVRRLGIGPTMIVMLIPLGATMMAIPLAPQPVAMAALFLGAAQFGDMFRTIYFINDISLRQAVTPKRLLGRVNAGTQVLIAAVAPLGALVGGYLGEHIGVRETFYLSAFGPLLACVLLFASPLRHLKSVPVSD